MQSHYEQVRDLFLQATELPDGQERERWLTAACGDDAALRAEVEKMLSLETKAEVLLEPLKTAPRTSSCDSPSTMVLPPIGNRAPEEGPGTVIGRYKLLEQIGEGGFGLVYMAEQQEPVHRRVALKIIKLGMDTNEVIARFDAERQALALMDHPSVARVLDAGSTASGRLFFVMELVRGMPITDFCDRHRLSPRERIELFTAVCHAVQHAHSKGIIHRDLKPSNILVTMLDDKPVPKIIDFGIAKAIQAPLTQRTLFTRFGQMIGTPVYMSPEHMAGTDVDTRTDIYSLGVILYELLTGKQPFDLTQLRKAGDREMLRIIQEDDPPAPSTRLTRLGQELTEVAQHRNVNARRLSELLKGDLDWITMKALRKDRTRRYETPLALAEDLQRHLAHQPVSAGPPGVSYRCWKFVRRHRYGVTAAAGIALSLLVGLVLALSGLMQAREQRERAILAERSADQQRQLAEMEAQRARAKELRARQISYASDMALAGHALDVSNIGRTLALLRRHAGERGTNDLRGWEWSYLWKQCRSDELFQLGQSSNSVLSCSISADGAWLLTGDLDATVSLWDVQAHRRVAQHTNVHQDVVMSPAAREFVAADGTVRDVSTGRVLHRLEVNYLKKPAFSGDGRFLAAFGVEELFIFDCEKWRLLGRYKGFAAQSMHVGGLAFSRDGAWLAVGMEQGGVAIVDTSTGEVLRSWKAHNDRVTALALSPDGTILATSAGYSDDQVKLWHPTEMRLIAALKGHRAWVTSLSFSPDGTLLASGSADQNIIVWDLARAEKLLSFKGHLQEVWGVSFLPDSRTLLSASKDGTIKAWRVPSREVVSGTAVAVDDKPIPAAVAFSPRGNELLGLNSRGMVGRWAMPGMRFLGWIDALSTNNQLLVSCGPLARLVAADDHGVLRVWDFQTKTLATTVAAAGASNRIIWAGFAPLPKRLVTVASDHRVEQFDALTCKHVGGWSVPDTREATSGNISVSPDAKYIARAGKSLMIYDLASGRLLTNIQGHRFYTDAVEFSPDGALVATGSMDGTAKLWRVGTWELLGTLTGNLLGVHSIAFSPDGRRLATGSLSNEAIKLWDLATFQEVLNLSSPNDLIWFLRFSPEGRHLVAFGTARGLNCWSAPLLEDLSLENRLSPPPEMD